ncbi:aromatic ring-hydroxylating dioxygenase subunit alpha [Streptomyces sp. NPDC000070]|uniref:aromatic ring-hydroxylating oxygenase subunit alpha n=1 Tax=Streptomyces sp. NPDC000070 TaxID=3154240 RepID=UPI0033308B0C
MTDTVTGARGTTQTLPPRAYFDADWFEREQLELFGRTWHYAGTADDYAAPGAYRSIQAGRHPLVVVRGHDGELRAFHNVCRHRGTAVLPGSGRVERHIVCPYHNWRYGLDGCLLAVTQRKEVDPGLDRSELGLHPAAAAVWRGLVFVHPDPEPEPLTDWLADLPDRMAPYDPEQLAEVGAARQYHLKCNWKVFMENALDNYHLGYVHKDTLVGYDHKRQEQYRCGERHWYFYEPPLEPGRLPPMDAGSGLKPIAQDPHWYGSSFGLIFPNLFVLTSATWWSSIQVIPTGPETTTLELRARFLPGQTGRIALGALREAASGLVQRVLAQGILRRQPAYDLVEEDVFCCEAVQVGIKSPRFSVGPLAYRLEGGIQTFQRNVLDYVPLEG